MFFHKIKKIIKKYCALKKSMIYSLSKKYLQIKKYPKKNVQFFFKIKDDFFFVFF